MSLWAYRTWADACNAVAVVINVALGVSNVARGHFVIACLQWAIVWFCLTMMVFTLRARRKTARLKAETRAIWERLAPRPKGVRIRRTDGTVLSCELIYGGRDDEGDHHWEVAGVVMRPGDLLEIDELPANTGLDWRGE